MRLITYRFAPIFLKVINEGVDYGKSNVQNFFYLVLAQLNIERQPVNNAVSKLDELIEAIFKQRDALANLPPSAQKLPELDSKPV